MSDSVRTAHYPLHANDNTKETIVGTQANETTTHEYKAITTDWDESPDGDFRLIHKGNNVIIEHSESGIAITCVEDTGTRKPNAEGMKAWVDPTPWTYQEVDLAAGATLRAYYKEPVFDVEGMHDVKHRFTLLALHTTNETGHTKKALLGSLRQFDKGHTHGDERSENGIQDFDSHTGEWR